jgi:hypothetical protein
MYPAATPAYNCITPPNGFLDQAPRQAGSFPVPAVLHRRLSMAPAQCGWNVVRDEAGEGGVARRGAYMQLPYGFIAYRWFPSSGHLFVQFVLL